MIPTIHANNLIFKQHPQITKGIGKSGQISLGKQFAGRSVLVDLIAISWAEQNPPQSSNLEDLEKEIRTRS